MGKRVGSMPSIKGMLPGCPFIFFLAVVKSSSIMVK